MDFSKFDNQVNLDQLKKDAEEAEKNGASNYPEIEDGTYIGKFEKLELGETKDGRPMFKAMFRITEGDHKKSCLFTNKRLRRNNIKLKGDSNLLFVSHETFCTSTLLNCFT